MNAGPEARYENGHKNELDDGINAGQPAPTGAEQRIELASLAAGEREGDGALSAPSGIICLCVVAGRHQCSADPVQLTRALGLNLASPVTDAQILLAAKELGLKANVVEGRLRSVAPKRRYWPGSVKRRFIVISYMQGYVPGRRSRRRPNH